MALSFELDGTILHVTQVTMGATTTRVEHWYYDIATWQVSSHGRLGDRPDRPMTEEAIAWVKKHYLPKVQLAA